jgi:hypothetical protein
VHGPTSSHDIGYLGKYFWVILSIDYSTCSATRVDYSDVLLFNDN